MKENEIEAVEFPPKASAALIERGIAALREECLLKLDGQRSAKIGFHT